MNPNQLINYDSNKLYRHFRELGNLRGRLEPFQSVSIFNKLRYYFSFTIKNKTPRLILKK